MVVHWCTLSLCYHLQVFTRQPSHCWGDRKSVAQSKVWKGHSKYISLLANNDAVSRLGLFLLVSKSVLPRIAAFSADNLFQHWKGKVSVFWNFFPNQRLTNEMPKTSNRYVLISWILGRFELFNGRQPLVKRWDGNDPWQKPTPKNMTCSSLAVGQDWTFPFFPF